MGKNKKSDETPQPMGQGVVKVDKPVPGVNRQRPCYALVTLVDEVVDLFPEVTSTYDGVDGRGAALQGVFDATDLEPEVREDFFFLLSSLENDPRVKDVVVDGSTLILGFHSNPRTQDSREPFNLGDALLVLVETGSF